MSAALWEGRRVILCVGSGGVGKTTASAALAMAAAASGLRTLVMTIDPARRLAHAMGLAEFGNVERELTPEMVERWGVRLKAPLWVLMPDVKRTFDDLVERILPDGERRQRLLKNRFYQQFSTVLAGSLEYAAVEKLYEVHTSGRYDLVVVDTPPSQNAVDFLDAPGRILDFLESETVQWLLKPYVLAGSFSLKLFDFGSSFILKTLSKLAGADTLRELAEMILAFQGTYEGFRERSRQVRTLLASEDLSFVLVTTPDSQRIAAMTRFRDEIAAAGLKPRALVVNRVRADALAATDADVLRRRVHDLLLPSEFASAWPALQDERAMTARTRELVAAMRATWAPAPVIELPELPLDAHDLESLAHLHRRFLSR